MRRSPRTTTVKSALAAVKKTTTDAIKLGPSKDFQTALKIVDRAERALNVKTAPETEEDGA